MESVAPFVLPGLLVLIVLLIGYVTIYWVNDGSDADEADSFVRGQYRSSLSDGLRRWVRRWFSLR